MYTSHPISNEEFIKKAGKIVMFIKSTCPYCRIAKEKLTEAGFGPHLVTVWTNPSIMATLHKKTKQRSVPQVFVKGRFIGGCNDGPFTGAGTVPNIGNGVIKKLLALET